MKGLLYKEFCMFKPQLKSWGGAFAIILIYAFIFKNVTMLFMMVAVIGIMNSVTSFSYDKMYRCEELIAALPVSRKQMVQSKYLFLLGLDLILAAASSVLVFAVSLFERADLIELAASGAAVLGVTVLMQAVVLPLVYKMGPDKARIFYMIIGMCPVVILFGLNELDMLPPLTEEFVFSMLKAAPFVVIAVLIISFFISVGIYRKKDL